MGGSTTTNTNGSSQSINEIPQWVQNAGQANYGLAQQVASQPLQQYQGQLVADVSPQMQQAWNLAANSGSVGVGAQNAAQAGFMNAENYTPQNVSGSTVKPQMVTAGQLSNTNLDPYMNPYTQDVINKTLPIMQQGLALQQNQQQNQANSANAYGGSRQAIQQGVTQAQGALNEGQMAAQLNQANFAQAQQGALADIGNTLKASQGNQVTALSAGEANQANALQAAMANQAAGLTANGQSIAAATGLGTLGNQQMQNQLAQYGMLTSAGAGQEQQQQNDINAQIAKFQQAWSYPQQQLGMMESSLGMVPYNSGTSGSSASTSETQTSNPAALAGNAFGMLGDLFGGPAMGAGGLFNPGSDRRLKTDIRKIGMHHTGIPMYSYRYKGDPKTYPKIAGPMAEDVMKIAPHAVHAVDTAGHLAVHMPTLDAIRGTVSRYGGGLDTNALPPSSPGVARAIGMLAPSRTPGRLSPFATPPTRAPIAGALSGGR